MSNSEEALSALYHALRAPRRRAVIHFLQQDDDEVITTRELARKIASREQGLTDQQATGEPYRNVYNALSQTHLPTLARAGIIIYDPQRQTVLHGKRFELAALLLEINTPTVKTFGSMTEEDDDDTHNHR